jgi:PAS domain S-box-containing protein
MKSGLTRYRLLVLSGIGILITVLAVMAANLVSQLRTLSAAAGDNTQWSIAQLDTEFANLNATLTDELAGQGLSGDDVRLRLEIALSRLNIINSGRAAVIFSDSDEAAGLIDPINAFAAATVARLDSSETLSETDLRQIHQMVRDVRGDVRKIALLGVRLGAEQSRARRADFARQLSWTGGIAIALLILMAILMRFLIRLLDRAAERDRELLTSSRQLASTIAASLDAIITADDEGKIIAFNASAERVFGWTSDEILGRTMDDTIIPHRMRQAHRDGMKRYLDTGTPRVVDAGRVELAALRKSGEEFPVELNITTTDVAGRKTFIAYVRDISERKINEQKLIDTRDRALNMDKAKSRFLTVMSHEMRTPLNGVLGVLDLLKTTPLTPQQDRYARIATASSEILLEYVNEALDITRVETGALQFSYHDFDLPALMDGLVDVLGPLAQEKQLSLSFDIEKTMQMWFHGDNHRIRQILMNLLGNAIKFTDTGGIQMTVRGIHGPESSSVRFAVTDTGEGIAPDDQEQVFEDFIVLAQSEGRQNRGDGLGLSIARRIAREMGGDIALESAVGAGSTFTLTLPLKRVDKPAVLKEDTAGNVKEMQPRTVLLVEDNDINRRVLRDMLKMIGHDVTEAADGAECLEKVARDRFDLIIMDISMPRMGGIDATQAIRSGTGPNKDTPIFGLTAHGTEEYRHPAESAGMTRLYAKPMRLDVLRGIFADLDISETAAPLGDYNTDALDELISALGVEKVRTTTQKFFDELEGFIAGLDAPEQTTDPVSIAAAAHKLKGAAAVLGQEQLEALLARFETDRGDDVMPSRAGHTKTLQNAAEDAKAATQQRLEAAQNGRHNG